MKLSDHDELEEAIECNDATRVERVCRTNAELVRIGWRDGVRSWVAFAMTREFHRIAEVLLDCGADINQGKKDYPRENALFGCIASNRLDGARFLLEHGASTKVPGIVCGAVVATRNAFELVKLLDEHGADIHEVSPGGFSGGIMNPLSLAMDYGLEDIVEYLKSRGCRLPHQSDVDRYKSLYPDLEHLSLPEIPAGETTPSGVELHTVVDHFANKVGPVEKLSLIQIVPSGIPISVHAIPAGEGRPFVTLFTTGLSERPMKLPDGETQFSRAEIYIQLPPDWKYREYDDPTWGWPQEWLRSMAQYPHQHDTWLGGPVTLVANGDPPQPLAPNTKFTTLLLMTDQSLVDAAGDKIHLYRMMPLYTEERNLELQEGIGYLLNAFDRHNISFIVDMQRRNVALAP